MQEADHVVLLCYLLHQLHGELVVVGGNVGGGEEGRQLVLCGGNLVVLGLGHDAELPQLLVQFLHKCGDAGLYRTEVVIFKLLTLGRLRAEEGAAGVHQVFALLVNALVDEEIFLFGADGGADGGDVVVAEELDDAHALTVDGLHGTQQRSFFIQRLAAVGAERGRDAEHVVFYKCVRGGVPCGVAASLKGGAQAAGGEAGGVRLTLYKLLARKFHDDLAAFHGGDEAVVLLGGDAGHGLEPMGEMGGALFDSPVLHGVCDYGRGGAVKTLAVLNGTLHLLEYVLGEPCAHNGVVENHGAKKFGDSVHVYTSHIFEKIAAKTPCQCTTSLPFQYVRIIFLAASFVNGAACKKSIISTENFCTLFLFFVGADDALGHIAAGQTGVHRGLFDVAVRVALAHAEV